MADRDWLSRQLEASRPRLRGVAYRLLGSLPEAEDAVQEAWLRLGRTETAAIENLGGWLTTVVSRVCPGMLRARRSRREEPIGADAARAAAPRGEGADPEGEALLADSVGVALLVAMGTLSPAERLAFVLHDLFAMPFEEIAPIVGRSPEAARQLASRARRRVRGAGETPVGDTDRRREVLEAFLRAVRDGNLEALLAVLDPDAVLRIDAAASLSGEDRELHGAAQWAARFLAMSRGLRFVQPALVDGEIGLVHAPHGRLARVVVLRFAAGKVAGVEIVGEAARLREMEIAVL